MVSGELPRRTTCRPCARFATDRRRLARRNFLRPLRPRRRPRKAAIPYKWRRSRPCAFELSRFAICGLLYCAPVEITMARGGECSATVEDDLIGPLSQLSRTTLGAIIIFAPNFCACVVARVAILPGDSGRESQDNFRSSNWIRPVRPEHRSRSRARPGLPKPRRRRLPDPKGRRRR